MYELAASNKIKFSSYLINLQKLAESGIYSKENKNYRNSRRELFYITVKFMTQLIITFNSHEDSDI